MKVSMVDQLKIAGTSLQYAMESITKLARIVSRIETFKAGLISSNMAMLQITEILDEPSDVMRHCKADGCDIIFKPARIDQEYCSDKCKWRQNKRDQRKESRE